MNKCWPPAVLVLALTGCATKPEQARLRYPEPPAVHTVKVPVVHQVVPRVSPPQPAPQPPKPEVCTDDTCQLPGHE